MVKQTVEPEFRHQKETDDKNKNLDDLKWIQLSNNEKTVMAEANISEIDIEGINQHTLLVNIDEGSMISADNAQQITNPQTTNDQPEQNKIKTHSRLNKIEKRLEIIEEIIDIEHIEQDIRSYYEAEIAASAVEETYGDDWYAENTDWYENLEDGEDER
jgi:hypothetical protein